MSDAVYVAIITAIAPIGLYLIQQRKIKHDVIEENRKLISENSAMIERYQTETRDRLTDLNETLTKSTAQMERMERGQKALLRHDLESKHAKYMAQGQITSTQHREFLEEYDVYHSEGGNGTVTAMVRDLSKLPIVDPITIDPLDVRDLV